MCRQEEASLDTPVNHDTDKLILRIMKPTVYRIIKFKEFAFFFYNYYKIYDNHSSSVIMKSESIDKSSRLWHDLGDCIIYWSSWIVLDKAYLFEKCIFWPPSKAWLMTADSSHMTTGTLSA